MVLTFSNETFNIKAKFYENMVKLEGRYYLDEMPKDLDKRPVKYRKLKNGKISVYTEFYIPNGFIYDALCIDDDEVKEKLGNWITNLIDAISKQRGVEPPKNKEG